MSPFLKALLAANLLALAVLAFVFPHLMVGPGKLIPGHRQLDGDCFACHAPLRGAASERCVACHKPSDIGRLTTSGQPIAKPLVATPFHQKLSSQDCVGCHSDHAGVKRYRTEGRFNHALLQRDTAAQCQSCHQPPVDALHRQTAASGSCGQCHGQTAWKPAKFDHDKSFLLDRDHAASCATCHVRNDYSRYTCYGCHEHSPESVRREHVKEGIRDYDNCVECHRSADEHDIRGGERGGERSHHKRDRREHDDD